MRRSVMNKVELKDEAEMRKDETFTELNLNT